MNNEKKLKVTGKYGSFEFSETACPYNENAHGEQVVTCKESIRRQIINAGKEDMMNLFCFSEEIE